MNSACNFEFAALSVARNYRRALIREFSSQLKGKVIEIGSGIGQMTRELSSVPSIQKLQSIEPDHAFCEEFWSALPGHALIEGTIFDVTDLEWDAIVSVNVLEHIEKDREELAAYARLLSARKGTLNLFVPARQELYAPIDKDFGHFRRYGKHELRQKLEEAGFIVEKIRYYNFVGYGAWWFKFCLLKARSFKLAEVRAYDRAIFPAMHFFERFISPPIGQSLLVVARAR